MFNDNKKEMKKKKDEMTKGLKQLIQQKMEREKSGLTKVSILMHEENVFMTLSIRFIV